MENSMSKVQTPKLFLNTFWCTIFVCNVTVLYVILILLKLKYYKTIYNNISIMSHT